MTEPRTSSPGVGTYICSFCNHPSISLAAIRDHLESSHRDKVFTDEDFISSVIYKPHSLAISTSSHTSEPAQASPSSVDGKKKSSTIRCKLCCESFVEGKEYLRHLKSCRASTSAGGSTSASKAPAKARATRSGATRGRTRGGKTKVPTATETKVGKRGGKKSRGRGAATVSEQLARTKREKATKTSPTTSNALVSSTRNAPSPRNSSQPGGSASPVHGSRSTMTSQFHSTFSSSDSPLPYCSLCDCQFSMQTTYQIHLESKDHKAQEQIHMEKEKRKNKLYSCSLCPDQGPWNHRRQFKEHMHTYQHKMAKKVEAMVSKIFTDQPIDDNLEELQEEQRQQAEKEGGDRAGTEGNPSKEEIMKTESEEECATTSSSSIPSPSAVVIAYAEQSKLTPTITSKGAKIKPEKRSPAELAEFVRKMLEPAKDFVIPLPPSQRPPQFSAQGVRVPSSFTVLNDMPNKLLPCNLDLSKPLDQMCTPLGGQSRDRQMEIWEEAVTMVRKLASYSSAHTSLQSQEPTFTIQ